MRSIGLSRRRDLLRHQERPACRISRSIVSDAPASAAAVFTTNRAQAAPVVVSRQRLAASGGRARVVAINSGCANACTGPEGLATAGAMADAAARAAACGPDEALIASTGVIGVALDRERVLSGIATAAAALHAGGGSDAATAIMTTDPFPKASAVEISTPAGSFRVGGIAKGSGMIEPMMATMLAVVTTDARVAPAALQRALAAAVDVTFNAISVDGECSTNDCVFALANGASGVAFDDADDSILVDALRRVCETLAIGIVRGGEGATKLVTVTVTGAASTDDARRAARAIANSPLVKTAVHGADPELGAPRGRRGPRGRAVPPGERAREHRRGRAVRRRAPARRAGAGGLAAPAGTRGRAARRPGHGRRGVGPHVDLRSQRRVRAHQCGVQNMSQSSTANAACPRGSRPSSCPCSTSPRRSSDLCLGLAASLKAARAAGVRGASPLAGRHVALLFDKPSLRTRSTFMIAVRELGGDVIEPPADVALGGRESIEDVARNLERWVHGAVIRTFEQARVERFAAAAPSLAVINALTDEEHPCQALADCLTLVERWGTLRGRTMAFVGDGNNVAASLAQAAAMLGGQVVVASPPGFELPPAVIESVRSVARFGGGVDVTNDPVEAVVPRRRRVHGRLGLDGPGARSRRSAGAPSSRSR